jgi:hypothetical protein
MALLTAPTAQAKMTKSAKSGVYLPYILHLAPADLSGYNTCPKATAGCKAACLNTAGMGVFNNVQKARIQKTKYFFEQRREFYAQLIKEVASAERKANKLGKQLTMRLNGTSDLQWEAYKMQDGKTIFELFPNVIFYDYTKIEKRQPKPFSNYSLTFSAADGNDNDVAVALQKGMNVAVVFRGDTLPQEWQGKTVIDGDTDDLRFLDPQNVVVGLRAKGKAKKDKSGFVKDGTYFALPVM